MSLNEGRDLLMTCVIAMQKVVGSNPISRFFANSLHVGGSDPARVAENKIKPPPHIAFISGTNSN
jgi:hypothetical protein